MSADKSRPANLEEAIKVVYFYKGSDSSLPLATFDNRDGELFKTGNTLKNIFKNYKHELNFNFYKFTLTKIWLAWLS